MGIQVATIGQNATPLDQERTAVFWYPKHALIVPLALFFVLVQSISFFIPPLQSPDEDDHLKRAYLLSKGEIFLRSENHLTGGDIDTGLLDYIGHFKNTWYRYDHKITASDVSLSRRIPWSGKRKFSDLPGIALYFPLPYVPQSLAFMVGEKAGLSVGTTYYLARAFSLAATLGLLWAALLLYPVPLFVIALFVIPMTLFQMGSATLDSVSYGICVLTGSLFMRGADARASFTSAMQIALFSCLFMLATSRINLIALTLLPAVLYTVRRSRAYLVSSAILFCSSFAWIGFSLATVHGAFELNRMQIVKTYLNDISYCIDILIVTVTNVDQLQYYWRTFIGVLGWLDTPLDSRVYLLSGVLLGALMLISLQYDGRKLFHRGSLALACGAGISSLLLFVILLVTWTAYPAAIIEGVQGRYFTPMLIFLGFSVFNRRLSVRETRIGLLMVFLMILLSVAGMAPRLLDRYWMSG